MKHALTVAHYSFAALLLVTIGLGVSGCGDSASVNPEAQLASLRLTPGTLSPTFSSGILDYAVAVPTTVGSVTVTAAPQDNSTTLTINGISTEAGEGRAIQLNTSGSPTTIRLTLSAPSGTQSTYIVTVTRLSANDSLSALSVNPGSLSPAFDPFKQNYTVEVATTVSSMIVNATKADPNAVISGSLPNEGQATIPLGGPGTTTPVSIIVTAPSGNSKTYGITIKRAAPSNDNNLSALNVSAGSLDPAFAAGTVNYMVNVASNVDTMTVFATKSDPSAVMASGGTVIAAAGVQTGQVSAPLGLGTTTSVSITVIAPNGRSKDYTINVFRPSR